MKHLTNMSRIRILPFEAENITTKTNQVLTEKEIASFINDPQERLKISLQIALIYLKDTYKTKLLQDGGKTMVVFNPICDIILRGKFDLCKEILENITDYEFKYFILNTPVQWKYMSGENLSIKDDLDARYELVSKFVSSDVKDKILSTLRSNVEDDVLSSIECKFDPHFNYELPLSLAILSGN